MEHNKQLLIIGIAVLLVITLFGTKKLSEGFLSGPPEPKEVWQQNYREAMVANNIKLDYTQAQAVIDYLSPEIQDVINNMDSTSPEDAIKKARSYVLDKITYNSAGITPQYCYGETATSALKIGTGDCVSMVKLGTAILRGQGIAVRTLGGCVKWSGTCSTLMGTVPLPLQKADIYDGKKRGYLHEWSEVWLPERGWILVDFTNGAIYEKGCEDYLIYDYDEGHYRDICVITDQDFINQCKVA